MCVCLLRVFDHVFFSFRLLSPRLAAAAAVVVVGVVVGVGATDGILAAQTMHITNELIHNPGVNEKLDEMGVNFVPGACEHSRTGGRWV